MRSGGTSVVKLQKRYMEERLVSLASEDGTAAKDRFLLRYRAVKDVRLLSLLVRQFSAQTVAALVQGC